MGKASKILLDFEVGRLTNSIENTISGDSFATDISILSKADIANVTKANGWLFDWRHEYRQPDREVYKLTIANNPSVIQGLVSLSPREDNVYMHLIESASFNKGKSKLYEGVPGNLVAYACKLSFQRGTDGYVSFVSKTALINHYVQSLGAIHYGGHLMVINTRAALLLTNKYFKE